MEGLIADLERRKEEARLAGGEERIRLQHSLGRYTARERIDRLLDPGSFLELGLLSRSEYPGAEARSPGDGLVCGIGRIGGRPVVVEASDKTVLAATEGAVHMRKAKAVHEYAVKRGFPIINLGEGGGLRMPDGMGADGISDKMMPMDLLLHGRRVPFVAAIMGDSYGGPTWFAVSADFAVQVMGTCMAVSGPRMLEVATGERVTPEELGGWRVHAGLTGQIDAFAENDDHCLTVIKEFLAYMPSNASEEPPFAATDDSPDRRVDEVTRLVPTRRNRAYDMRRVVDLLVDDGETNWLRTGNFDSSPYRAAAKYLIDDVIDPRDTRRVLCRAIEHACLKKGSKSRRLLANWPTGY